MTEPISLAEVTATAEATFGDLVKAVVDVGRSVLAVEAGMHSDLEALPLDEGARQADLWGINLYLPNSACPSSSSSTR